MFPTVPEDRSALTVEELRNLSRQIRTALIAELRRPREVRLSDEEIATWRQTGKDLAAEAQRQQDEADALAELEAEEQAEAEATEEVEEVEEIEATEEVEEVEEPELVPAGASAPVVHTSVGGPPATPTASPSGNGAVFSEQLVAYDGVPGKRQGESFHNWGEIAAALLDKASGIKSNSAEKFPIARMDGQFAPHMVMGDNYVDNLKLFEAEEILAALCAPLPPIYDLACMNTLARPVKASLPVFQNSSRGGATIYPSPTLADITTGVGQWTHEDDANEAAVKEACATIECATPVEYRWYAVYRCITIKNMLAMTFPELVEAYLNRLGAAFARLAEVLLLEAMATETDEITAHTLGYNASVSITSNILNYLALYREQQRWGDQEFDAWMPRWIVPALQADQIRRRNTNGQVLSVPSEAQIRQVFVDAGVTPHFFLDTPSWATPIPALQVTGNLGWFTRNLEMIIAPRGKFAVMDRGQLNIGVTGNNIYRDNESNRRNQFTMFWESFEGIINTDTCPAHVLVFDNLCFNGQQIADLVINCEGGDEVGAAS